MSELKICNDLVSIIIPCFNGEKYVACILEALLKQTYENIQIIFVDDGSYDNTRSIYEKYSKRFEKKQIKNKYLYQDNKGQAEAINNALKYVEGEFLMWIDSDDYVEDNHIEKKVKCLKDNPDCQLVRCEGRIVDDTNKEIGKIKNVFLSHSHFLDILLGYNSCTGGLYMVRSNEFFEIFTDRKIISSKAGQNIQMLIPLINRYKTCYLNEEIFTYLEHEDSHSHQYNTLLKMESRIQQVYLLRDNILKSIRNQLTYNQNLLLCSLISKKKLIEQLNTILNAEFCSHYNEFIESVIKKYVDSFNKKPDFKLNYWIWGFTERTRKLAAYLFKYSGIVIKGFLDSDIKKQNKKTVFTLGELDLDSDYILIPINFYQDIIKQLNGANLKIGKDYSYINYEILRNMNMYEKSRNCNLSIC